MGFSRVTVVKIMCVIIGTSTTALALDVHSVRQGGNASVMLSANVNGYAAVSELSSLNAARPFYVHERVDPTILRSDQRDRFDVSVVEKTETRLQVALLISNVQVDDGGVYVLSVRETKDRQAIIDYTYEAYVDVVVPPGKAECNISHYSAGKRAVLCRASAGTDTGGDIICYQDSERIPAIGSTVSTVHSSDLITANFLVHAYSPISCCSAGTNETKSQDSCLDFVGKLSSNGNFQTDLPSDAPAFTNDQPGIVTSTQLLREKDALSSSSPETLPEYDQKRELSFGSVLKISMVFVSVLVIGVSVVLVCLVVKIQKSLRRIKNVNSGLKNEHILNNILTAKQSKDITLLPNSQDFQVKPMKCVGMT